MKSLLLLTFLFPAAVLLAAPSLAATPEEDKAAPFAAALELKTPAPALAETGPVAGAEFIPEGADLPPLLKFEQPVFELPALESGPRTDAPGRSLGEFNLAERLDSHADLFTRKLGARDWNLSVAGNPEFDIAYLRLERPGEKQLHKIKDVNELRGKGVNIKVDDKTLYNFKVSINIFSPTRKSTLKITPLQGTQGPGHKIKTGAILDRVQEKSFVFKTNGAEFWTLYGTDVDPQTNWFAATRSFLIIRENGLSTKAWPIAEAALPVGETVTATLGDTKIVLRRGADGIVRFYEPGNKGGRIARR